MADEVKDGGCAFAALGVSPVGDVFHEPGMSLRDWFAGQVLAGIMAQSHAGPKDWTEMGHGWGEDCCNDLNKHSKVVALTLAGFAYQMADTMLAERAKAVKP